MTKADFARYRDRMIRVLDHIDRNLDAELDLASLAGIAAFSPHHFHRQFAALFGVSLYRYVQLLRLKRASYRLAFRDWERGHRHRARCRIRGAGRLRPGISPAHRAGTVGI